MQFSLFDNDDLEDALEQDNRLHQGQYFTIAPNKTVFINKRDGVMAVTKRLDTLGRLNEMRFPVTRFPILPVEVIRWDENQFYVRLVYSNKANAPKEKIISLDAIKKKGMPELRQVLFAEGVMLNSMESAALGKILLDVIRVGTVNGKIKMRNKVSRREWFVRGIQLQARSTVAPLSLVRSESRAIH